MPVRDAEQETCLDSAMDPVLGLLRMVVDRLDFAPAEEAKVVGRDALKVAFILRDEALAKPIPAAWPAPEAARASLAVWGGPRPPLVQTHAAPRSISGELVFDAETGLLLGASLSGRFAVRKEERDAELEVGLSLEAGRLEAEVEAPADARHYKDRHRILADQERLLGKSRVAKVTALPRPGDAPPLRLGPDEAALDAEDLPQRFDDEDAPP